jgi:hypothetical protein
VGFLVKEIFAWKPLCKERIYPHPGGCGFHENTKMTHAIVNDIVCELDKRPIEWQKALEIYKQHPKASESRNYDVHFVAKKLLEIHLRKSLEEICRNYVAQGRVKLDPIGDNTEKGKYTFKRDRDYRSIVFRKDIPRQNLSEADQIILCDECLVFFKLKTGRYHYASRSTAHSLKPEYKANMSHLFGKFLHRDKSKDCFVLIVPADQVKIESSLYTAFTSKKDNFLISLPEKREEYLARVGEMRERNGI